MQAKRVTIFAGHFGSGKTNLALNYAFWLKRQKDKVLLCDLDIVNPYFRTVDSKDKLASGGIRLISSPYANTNVEIPAFPADTQTVFDDLDAFAVIDLGGDERGALALGRYAKNLHRENDFDMLLVANPFRPLTGTLEGLREIVQEIEAAAKVPFTGLVNNANLGAETSLADICDSLPYAKEAAMALGLPLRMTAIHNTLLPGEGNELAQIETESEVFPIEIFEKPNWIL